jgi:L-ascorbate metabolism protein UlaG (beta-lactamase superfamily)
MNASEAAELAALLRPRFAVPMHYTFTAGPLRDRLLLKYTGTSGQFVQEMARRETTTEVHVLEPGQPLHIDAA